MVAAGAACPIWPALIGAVIETEEVHLHSSAASKTNKLNHDLSSVLVQVNNTEATIEVIFPGTARFLLSTCSTDVTTNPTPVTAAKLEKQTMNHSCG